MPARKPSTKQHIGDFQKLPAPAKRALDAAGYTKLGQLAKVSEAELLKLHGMGPKALGIIRLTLASEGKSFAPEKKKK